MAHPRKTEKRYFDQYCKEVAGYYDRLLAAQPYLEKLRDWKPEQKKEKLSSEERKRLEQAGIPRAAIRNPENKTTKETVVLRLRWLRRANLVLNGIEAPKVEDELICRPDLLSDLLHAFDRADETYVLFLFHEVMHIRNWLVEFEGRVKSPPSGQEEGTQDAAPARVQQAEPWEGPDPRRWDMLSQHNARELKDAESLEGHRKWGERERFLEDRRRLELTRKITSWYSIDQREAIEKWYQSISMEDPPKVRRMLDFKLEEVVPQEFSLEKLVTCVLCPEIVKKKTAEGEEAAVPDPEKVKKALLERLIGSARQQSDLALLLGKLPSEWLRWEERPYVEQRRWLVGRNANPLANPGDKKSNHSDGEKLAQGSVPLPGTPGARDAGVRRSLRSLNPVGLCFSGGGIRSATFNLGVLQALAELNLLRHFDYLSTVSGGGYIHQWFAAWVLRSTSERPTPGATAASTVPDSLEVVEKALVPQPSSTLPQIEATQVTFLRRFSNYLTPITGILSADVWTMFAIWARNTFLNQMILVAGMLFFFALLRTLLSLLPKICEMKDQTPTPTAPMQTIVAIVCVCLYLFSIGIVAARMADLRRQLAGKPSFLWPQLRTNKWPVVSAVALLLAAVAYASLWMCNDGVPFGWTEVSWKVDLASFVGLCHCLPQDAQGSTLLGVAAIWSSVSGWIAFVPMRYEDSNPDRDIVPAYAWVLLSGVICGVVVFSLFGYLTNRLFLQPDSFWATTVRGSSNANVMQLVKYFDQLPVQHDIFLLLLPPALIAAHFLVSVLHVGLNRNVFRDEVLEWMARYRAWGFIVAGAWIGMFGLLIIALPLSHVLLSVNAGKWWAAATAVWSFVSAGGALSARTEPSGQLKQIARLALLAVAPYVFIFGILLAVCIVVCSVADPGSRTVNLHLLLILGISGLVCVLFGKTVDINEFSMYAFYRNRLARCYQGASVIDRAPDPFTGFSDNDRAVSLGELRIPLPDQLAMRSPWVPWGAPVAPPGQNLTPVEDADSKTTAPGKSVYLGPIPIFCCTANFTAGEDLAQQERKGASFAYTSINSGYDIPWTGVDLGAKERDLFYNGFRDTLDLGHPSGPTLADVCAASGAAASSLSGYRTTPALAFLMTFFNARLGVWKRNTRYLMRTIEKREANAPSDQSQSPKFALVHMFMELFGQVSAKDKFLYLSDGGFFDNMGLYELVRRGCRNILVCDAEEDGDLSFGGLSMALRRCRSDFGVEIDLDPRAIRKQTGSAYSGTHCVVGTIRYPNDDPKIPRRQCGKIVYLKSSLTGSEPADLLGYQLQHPAFPHDSTGNQWFSESEFESYRVLGRSIALSSLKPACALIKTAGDLLSSSAQDEFYSHLYDIWYPVKPSVEQHLGNHGKNLADMLTELRTNDDRAKRIYELFRQGNNWSNVKAKDRSYYDAFAFSLFEFIWRVYNDLDLQLEANREHPHGEIWMNTFRHWFKIKFLGLKWKDYRDRYPASFRHFVDEQLK